MDGYLPFFLAITANMTTATTSRASRSTAPQISGILRDTKAGLALGPGVVGETATFFGTCNCEEIDWKEEGGPR